MQNGNVPVLSPRRADERTHTLARFHISPGHHTVDVFQKQTVLRVHHCSLCNVHTEGLDVEHLHTGDDRTHAGLRVELIIGGIDIPSLKGHHLHTITHGPCGSHVSEVSRGCSDADLGRIPQFRRRCSESRGGGCSNDLARLDLRHHMRSDMRDSGVVKRQRGRQAQVKLG